MALWGLVVSHASQQLIGLGDPCLVDVTRTHRVAYRWLNSPVVRQASIEHAAGMPCPTPGIAAWHKTWSNPSQ
jgi:hypothetical protein